LMENRPQYKKSSYIYVKLALQEAITHEKTQFSTAYSRYNR
jgi:hypothetical protein